MDKRPCPSSWESVCGQVHPQQSWITGLKRQWHVSLISTIMFSPVFCHLFILNYFWMFFSLFLLYSSTQYLTLYYSKFCAKDSKVTRNIVSCHWRKVLNKWKRKGKVYGDKKEFGKLYKKQKKKSFITSVPDRLKEKFGDHKKKKHVFWKGHSQKIRASGN